MLRSLGIPLLWYIKMLNLDIDYEKMSKEELLEHLNLIDKMQEHEKYCSRDYLEPNEPQKRFWAMGSPDFAGDEVNPEPGERSQRAFFACNRGGKSFGAAWEMSYHLTGDYPQWWEGKRFDKPIKAVAASNTEEQTLLVCMAPLLGTDNRKNEEAIGTGMIPRDAIILESSIGNRSGFRTISVKHISGGVSTVRFSEYGKGAQALQGTAWDLVWLDENCPEMVHHELGIRLITTQGHMLLTFTPKWGYSDVMQQYYENRTGEEDYRDNFGYTRGSVWEMPHLSEVDIQRMKNITHRSLWPSVLEGKPAMGAGRVFDFPKSQVMYKSDEVDLSSSFPRLVGLDTAFKNDKYVAAWAAIDNDRDIIYIYDWYVHDFLVDGPCTIMDHIPKLLAKGCKDIPIITDSKIKETTLVDGSATITKYLEAGLNMLPQGFKNPPGITKQSGKAFNSRESGLSDMYERMSTGRLRIHSDFKDFWQEFNTFSMDEKTGKPQIKRDDCIDAVRYAAMTIIQGLGEKLGSPGWYSHDEDEQQEYFYQSY